MPIALPAALRLLVWLLLCLTGCLLLARSELDQLREAFETEARISHRLLSQRTVQHEAVLATLALLQPEVPAAGTGSAAQRLASVYPQVQNVLQRTEHQPWPQAGLELAEQSSRQSRSAALANVDFAAGRYQLVLAAAPASYALLIDVHGTVPWNEWSMPVQSSPIRVTLEHGPQVFVVQPGQLGQGGWNFEFHKHLASASQPFDLVARRQVGWGELPWSAMALWVAAVSAALLVWNAWQNQRQARRRAEELLRVGQVGRLNALGELAAGMAHELNQPLTAILANTQAAKRLLDGDTAELDTARHAMEQAVAQARRAADVLGRMRRMVEQPLAAQPLQPVSLDEVARGALELLMPQCRQQAVSASVTPGGNAVVLADRVALEQIVHNLLTNALQALELVAEGERHLSIALASHEGFGELRVIDSGPGIAADALPRIFEPFFSTREGGLGLGLSLCETLASGMGGQLRAEPHPPRGTVFVLSLPLAATSATKP